MVMLNFRKKSQGDYEDPNCHPNLSHAHSELDQVRGDKDCWNIALQPIKQVPMSLFMMCTVGNSISVMPVIMVCMMALKPIKAFMSVNTQFAAQDNPTVLQKIVYCAGNLACLAIALYKCHSMGLLSGLGDHWLELPETARKLAHAELNLASS